MSRTSSSDLQNSENLLDYAVIGIIGTGSFGTCYKVQEKKSQKYFVWKAVDYGSMSLHEKELLVTEVNLMGTLKHAHIVQYYGRIIHKSSGTLYIIMEWCEGGDLRALIRKCKTKRIKLNEKFIWKVLYQTAKALEACHSLLKQVTVLHRDIKPANIFLDQDYNVKLGDFGLAKILQHANFSSTIVGTPYYMSPEQIRGSKYNKKSDVWSLGCLIYELCCLVQPFDGCDLITLRDNIMKNRLSRIPLTYSDYLDRMVKFLLSSNHESRPSVEVIVHHPTVICNYEPNAKPFDLKPHIGNGDVEYHPYDIVNPLRGLDILKKKLGSHQERNEFQSSEDIYHQNLVNRLKLLREKESMLKAKEDTLNTRELVIKTKESSLERKQKQIEKREREVAAMQRATTKQTKSVIADRVKENRKSKIDVHLDSTTCSIDPGDSSAKPTAVKLNPQKIIKPVYFRKDGQKSCYVREPEEQNTKCENGTCRQPFTYVNDSNVMLVKKKSNSVANKYSNSIHKK